MAIFFLIRGNRITQEIDSEDIAVTALPLFGGGAAVSLLNKAHVIALMGRFNRTATQVIDDLGLVDERANTP